MFLHTCYVFHFYSSTFSWQGTAFKSACRYFICHKNSYVRDTGYVLYIYIFSPHICLFIVPYTCKWMDCMKHCFAGLCFRIFILTYKRLISYLPFMLCKFYSDEYSHAIYNSCLEVRHLARVSLYGPCWRGLSLLAHLQVKYCTRVRLFYFTFIHVYLNLFLHVHKRLFFLYAPLYCHLPFLLLRSENTAFAHLFKSDSFLLLRFDCVLFTTTFCCYFLSFFHYLSTFVCFIYTYPCSAESYQRRSTGTALAITSLHV